jgi:LytR cell envelope-related transcriptional attenuator
MASEPPTSEPPRPGDRRGANRIAPIRAALVLAGFLVAATVLVAVGSRPSVSGVTVTTTTVTTTAGGGGTTTTVGPTTTTVPRSSISVQVANGSEGAGLAEHYSALLSAQGWALKPPANANSEGITTSSVYYAAGQQEAAASIATALGLKASAVHPLSASVPVTGAAGNDIVVVIGADLAARAGT